MPDLLEKTITTEEVIAQVVKANGRVKLAAERLHTTEEQLVNILTTDKLAADSITDAIRIKILLKTYEQFGALNDLLSEKIAMAEPSDVLRLYTTIGKNLTEMVGKPENTLDAILKNLPPNVRESMIRLMAG